jgi:hypothetical protein
MELLFYCATSILQDKINYNGVNWARFIIDFEYLRK